MAFSLIPKYMRQSVLSIDPKWLKSLGIRLLLADLDNTLARYGQKEPGEELLLWRQELAREGIELFVLSNSRKPARVHTFCEDSGIRFINRAGKPKRGGFFKALEITGCMPEQTAIVGDQIFTDILGGNRAGVITVLVRPIALDTLPRALRFRLEAPIRWLCRNKEGWK